MPIWQAVLLGVIQGLTEFLPISSTAHLLVARGLLGHPYPEDAFTVVIQLGTLVAVFVYFRPDLIRLVHGLGSDLRQGRFATNADSRLAWLIALGTLPAIATGYFLKTWLKENFFQPRPIAVVAIVFALLMAAAEGWAKYRTRRGYRRRGEDDIRWFDALWIGLWQALALMPGGSRSGTTITGGLWAGLARPAAARFSFLLSLPTILGAGLKELYDEYQKLHAPQPGEATSLFASGDDLVALIVGTVVSAVVGYYAIAFLMNYLQRYSMAVFVLYRIGLGLVIFALVAEGWL
ncbi:MAG: undecaprenyl-diphosphatase UppP [Gemmataceae bacterium]|nr:undecaprenyl-diphosphatase UppP [Gemmata sp.]MDW8197258.1 undecaprenyl-diphosphatase UppP [Gemmataceae bacterium]